MGDSMNRRAIPRSEWMERSPPTIFNRSFILVKPSPRPAHRLLWIEAAAQILDGEVDGVALSVQRDVRRGAKRYA